MEIPELKNITKIKKISHGFNSIFDPTEEQNN